MLQVTQSQGLCVNNLDDFASQVCAKIVLLGKYIGYLLYYVVIDVNGLMSKG
jgi:hypothetical protein